MRSRDTRPIAWIKAARKAFVSFPKGAQDEILLALTVAAEGQKADIAKPLKGVGAGVFEVALHYRNRCVSDGLRAADRGAAVGCARLPEEGEAGDQDSNEGDQSDPRASETIEAGGSAMSKTADDGELVYGSGNVFRDFGRADADVQQTKALLAASIIGILDDEGLSTRKG